MPALIYGLQQLSEQHNIPIVNFGHAGNGNLHTNLLLDPDDPQQQHDAEQCLYVVYSQVLKLNGTISGEYGVGIEKRFSAITYRKNQGQMNVFMCYNCSALYPFACNSLISPFSPPICPAPTTTKQLQPPRNIVSTPLAIAMFLSVIIKR